MSSLSESERNALLQLARRAVVEAVTHGQLLQDIPSGGVFSQQRGVFVTLHVAGRLRGCIGVVEPSEALGDAIVRSAVSAAQQDPRFSPVRPAELSHLQIEISLLSLPAPLRPQEIQLGTHGLLVIQERQRGLLLPQVAVEHHLTPEQFLAETCRKAGLPADAWRSPETQVLGFTCEVFSAAPAKNS